MVFRACVVNAVRESEALIGNLIEFARDALDTAERSTRDVRQRSSIGDALRSLHAYRAELIKAYPTALMQIFAEGPSQAKPRQGSSGSGSGGGVDINELVLMDDADVMAQVELSRAQQIAAHATEAALAELNPLVSAAQGLRNVQPEGNPLRPENYIRALQQVVSDTGISAEVRQLWMRYMRERLAVLLVETYKNATKSLREHGVEPVGYAVASVPRGGGGYGGGPVGAGYGGGPVGAGYGGSPVGAGYVGYGYVPPPGTAPVTSYGVMAPAGGVPLAPGVVPMTPAGGVPLAPEAEEALLTVGILRQMLAGGGDPFAFDMAAAGVPVVPGAVATGGVPVSGSVPVVVTGGVPLVPGVPVTGAHGLGAAAAAGEAMEDLAHLERLVERLSGGAQAASAPVGNGGDATVLVSMPATVPMTATVPMSVSGTVLASASGTLPGAINADEVLSRMMMHIAQDTRLLPPMQAAMRNLEPALRQLVRSDARFFSDDQHPARRLLDEVTQRSLAFNNENAPAFGSFMRLVNEAVEHLTNIEIHDAAPFARVLGALERAWATQEQRLRAHREAKERELAQREQRELLAEKFSTDWRNLLGAKKLPPDVLGFLTGPWANVVALAQTNQPGDAQEGDPGGYLALVPLLLYCGRLDQLSRDDVQRIAADLGEMAPVVRRGLESIDAKDEETARALERLAQLQHEVLQYAASASDEARQEHPPVDVALPPEEEHRESGHGQPRVDTGHGPPVSDTGRTPLPPGPILSVGQWVEMMSGQRVARTQLTWCSPHNTLFLFTAADGSTQTMTRRMIDRMAADGLFAVLSSQPVVARALRTAGGKGPTTRR
jgi:hypothetical protein